MNRCSTASANEQIEILIHLQIGPKGLTLPFINLSLKISPAFQFSSPCYGIELQPFLCALNYTTKKNMDPGRNTNVSRMEILVYDFLFLLVFFHIHMLELFDNRSNLIGAHIINHILG